MIKADIDRPRLERSVKKFIKQLGESNSQAVVRWSVQVCRELAFSTQVYGKVGTKAKQHSAIYADAYNVLRVVDNLKKNKRGNFTSYNQGKSSSVAVKDVLNDPDAVNAFIEVNRKRRNSKTAKLDVRDRKVCDKKTFQAALQSRLARSGTAKGAWIGAGNDIAKAQKGEDKQNIGKNFLAYAQKHQKYGDAKKPTVGMRPSARISSKIRYSGDGYILTSGLLKRAIDMGLKNTVKYYRKRLKAIDKKDKP